MIRVEYECVTATNQPLYTTPELDLARKWARENAETFPGLRLEAVERIETRRRIWTDRQHLRVVA